MELLDLYKDNSISDRYWKSLKLIKNRLIPVTSLEFHFDKQTKEILYTKTPNYQMYEFISNNDLFEIVDKISQIGPEIKQFKYPYLAYLKDETQITNVDIQNKHINIKFLLKYGF